MPTTYRHEFISAGDAGRYDSVEYAPSSYSNLLWELEKPVLTAVVREFRKTHGRIDYLDFATGTGRVAAFLEHSVDVSTAIEISEAMVDRARLRLRRIELVCRDITDPTVAPDGCYDLITCFRFFLNAEPALRLEA